MNDFGKNLRQYLEMRDYRIVAKECVGLIERALRDVFMQHQTRLEEHDRLMAIKAEQEIGKGNKGIERFTLGELVGVFRKSKFIEAWGRISGKDMTSILMLNLDQLTKFRNKFIHEGREASRAEAELLFNWLQIILETFDLKPAAELLDETHETAVQQAIVPQQRGIVDIADLLNMHVSPLKLDQLIFSILGKEAIDELKGRTHQDRVKVFLEKISQAGKQEKLTKELTERFPEEFGERVDDAQPPPTSETEPGPPLSIAFMNRRAEWKCVVEKSEGVYHVFCGPAGYGKTALLHKIQEEFERQQWRCSYISLSEQNRFPNIIQKIVQHMQLSSDISYDEPGKMGERLGEVMSRQFENKQYKGFALLLDVDHEPSPSLIDTLKTMVEDVIPGIYDGLWKSEFFRSTPYSYRVVLAGRYIAARMQEFKCYSPYSTTTLAPFDESVIWDICRQYISDPAEKEAFAPHLLFYSGGHPCCLVHILETFRAAETTAEKFFHGQQYQVQIMALVSQEAERVRASIHKGFRVLFDRLCLYRRLDILLLEKLLQELLESQQIWRGIAEDAYDLAMKLKATYLIHWTDENCRYLHDGIVRRILTIRLREELIPEHFKFLCEKAKDFYLNRLKRSTEDRLYWAIEALFEYLQGHVHQIVNKTGRETLRRRFFDQELPQVLDALFDCDDPRSEQESLIGVLERDREFCFTLNYFLRDDAYTESPYHEMRRCIGAVGARRASQQASQKMGFPESFPVQPLQPLPMSSVEMLLESEMTVFTEAQQHHVLTVIAEVLKIERRAIRCVDVQLRIHDAEEQQSPFILQQKIVECLTSILSFYDKEALRAFVMSAGLDMQLRNQITFDRPPKQFFQFLIPVLVAYGILEDGRHALIAVLESAKNYVGQQGREQCDTLIREVDTLLHREKPLSTGIRATVELPTSSAIQLIELFTNHYEHLARKLHPLRVNTLRLVDQEREGSIALVDMMISATVPMIVKFLFDQVGSISQTGIVREYQKIEEAKTALAQYQQTDALGEADLEYVKEQVIVLCAMLRENGIDLTSTEIFIQWGEKRLNDEEFAIIVRRELELRLVSLGELPISSRKWRELEDMIDALNTNVAHLERARWKAGISGLEEDHAEFARQEAALRNTIQAARRLTANY